jgi:site-specific DNA-cytosine methylase
LATCGKQGFEKDPTTELIAGLVELADVMGANGFLLENVPGLWLSDHAVAPAGLGKHSLFSNLRRMAEARGFTIAAAPILNDARCGGFTSRDRVVVVADRQELHVLLPPLDLEKLQRPAQPGKVREVLAPVEEVDRQQVEVPGFFHEGDHFQGKTGALIVGTLLHGGVVEPGQWVALKGMPHPADKGCPEQWAAQVQWLKVSSISGEYSFGVDSRVLHFDQSNQVPISARDIKGVRVTSDEQWDLLTPGTVVVLARRPVLRRRGDPPLLWVIRAVERVGSSLALTLLSALNRDSFSSQCQASDVAAVVPTAIPVYGLDSIGITIRTFGAQPQGGSFLIWDSRLPECVRRLAGLEQWRLHGLSDAARFALQEAGVVQEHLGKYAANSITAAMARRFAELLAERAAFMDAVWEGDHPSGWLSPLAPASEGPGQKRAILVAFAQAADKKFQADPCVWAHPSGLLVPGVNFEQEGRAHKLAKTKVHNLLQAMAAGPLPEEVETLLASNRLTKVGAKGDGASLSDLHVFTVVMARHELVKSPGVWLPLSALRDGPLADLVEQAYTELATFMSPVAEGEPLADWHSASGALQDGWVQRTQSLIDLSEAKSGAFQPQPLLPQHQPVGLSSEAWVKAIDHCDRVHEELKRHLEAAGAQEWAQAVKPVPRQHLPHSLNVEASATLVPGSERHLLYNRTPTIPTAPVPLSKPQREPPRGFQPRGIGDLLSADAVASIVEWAKRQCKVLVQIREGREAKDRKGLVPLILGQEAFVPEARGIVWDLRNAAQGVVVPLDFTAIPYSHLDRDFISEMCQRLEWEDLQLRDFLLYGVTYLAPKELQIVLPPHLISLKGGYQQFLDDLVALEGLGWFPLFESIPFLPINLIPRGATPKSDGTMRITTDASWPHVHPTKGELQDPGGDLVSPLNVACQDGEWPHEGKPRIADIMDFVTALFNLKIETGWEFFGGSEDMKKWFNQFATRPEEYWKTCALFETEGRPLWYTEVVMTFGLRPASNVAQRGANFFMAILAWEMDRSDRVEIPKLRKESPALDRWLSQREVLQGQLAVVKEVFSEYLNDPRKESLPFKAFMAEPLRERGFSPEDIRFFAQLKEIERVSSYADVQTRLWIVPVYTDDNFMGALGIEVFTRLIVTWDEVAGKLKLLNSPAKRQIGCHLTWIGAGVLLTGAVVYIPPKKALKAGNRLRQALAGSLPREAYRSLVGLLEHFVYILMRDRSCMHDLYCPFEWPSFQDPQATFTPKGLLKANLLKWQKHILTECGASMLRVFNKAGVLKGSTPVFHITSDAAKEGAKVPGLGGFCHGYWVCYPLSPRELEMPIAVLEAAAFLLTFLMVDEILPVLEDVPPLERPRLLYGVDALATAFVSTREKTTKVGMVTFLAALKSSAAWSRRAPQAYLAHVYGERNLAADAASRGERKRLMRLCQMLHLTPREQALPQGFEAFMEELTDAVVRPSSPLPVRPAKQLRLLSADEQDLSVARANTPSSASFLALDYHIVTRADVIQEEVGVTRDFHNPLPGGPPKSLQELALEARSPMMIRNLLLGCHALHGVYYVVAEGPVFRLQAPLPSGYFQPGFTNGLLELRMRHPRDVVVPDEFAHPLIEHWITPQAHAACHAHGVRFFLCEPADSRGVPYRFLGRTRPRGDPGAKRPPPGGDGEGPSRKRPRRAKKSRSQNKPSEVLVLSDQLRYLSLREQYLATGMANMPTSASFIPAAERFLKLEGKGSRWGAGIAPGKVTKVHTLARSRPGFGGALPRVVPPPSKAKALLLKFESRRPSLGTGRHNGKVSWPHGVPAKAEAPLRSAPPAPVSLADGSLARQAGGLNLRNPAKQKGFVRQLQELAVRDSRQSVQQVQAQGSHLALGASGEQLSDLLDTVVEFTRLGEGAKSYGTYDSHWKRWVRFCEQWETSHWRDSFTANSGQDRHGYHNEVIILSLALLSALTEIRGKKGGPCKPNTARAFLRSVRKVHQMRGITMVPISSVSAVFKGCMARHVKLYGVESLLPDTKQPFHKVHVHRLAHLPDGAKLGSKIFRRAETWCRSWDAYVATSASTGMRKAEVAFTHPEATPITRSAVSWIVRGVAVPFLNKAQLASLREGDYVVLKPPPSKTDPFALIWGNRPIFGAFSLHDKANMARAIRDLLLHVDVPMEQWTTTALFVDNNLQPLTGSFIDTTLQAALRSFGLSKDEASRYSPHSFRIYLACALKSAGKSDAEIQMLCRWQSLDSLRLYARMDARQYSELIQAAQAADSRAISVSSLPVLDVDALHPAIKELMADQDAALDDVDRQIMASYDAY